jgi:hypothetical protein
VPLQSIYVLLGIVTGVGLLIGGIWRITGAAHKLIGAIVENTGATGRLSRNLIKLRRQTHDRLDEHEARLTRLEEAPDGQKPAADPRPPHRGPGRPGPDRGRRVDPL